MHEPMYEPMNQPADPWADPWTGQPADPRTAPGEPDRGHAAVPPPGAHPMGRRTAARHRKSSRSRRLAAGLALVSVLTATAITLTVDPAAPAPDGRPHLRSAR